MHESFKLPTTWVHVGQQVALSTMYRAGLAIGIAILAMQILCGCVSRGRCIMHESLLT